MGEFVIPALLFAFILFWIWAFLDLSFSTFKKAKWKFAWLLVIIFFPLVGSILYLLLSGEFKAKRRRRFNPGFNSHKH